jgi:chaperonin GroEL
MGKARRSACDQGQPVIVDGAGPRTQRRRKAQLRSEIEAPIRLDREKLEERLAKASGGVAVIKVGGHGPT